MSKGLCNLLLITWALLFAVVSWAGINSLIWLFRNLEVSWR